jgi:hypothetical protein
MLNGEELILNIKAGAGAIRKTGDQLEAGDEVGIIFGDLVDEGTLGVGSGRVLDFSKMTPRPAFFPPRPTMVEMLSVRRCLVSRASSGE